HNFRSPTDARTAALLKMPTPADRGTFHYDEVLPKMAAAGENCAEVWMASWFAEIEWVARWKNYSGLGKYNLSNAWKLDSVIDSAQRNNILVHLVIDNHGKLSSWVDAEWKDSPYNIANGGFLNNPLEFWSDQRARKAHKNKLRYIVARWGYSPTVMGWELVSELDLTGVTWNNHKIPEVRSWHQEMATYLDKIDPNRHLITTHYSGDYTTIDSVMARQAFMDYVVGDAYRKPDKDDIVSLVIESAYNAVAYKKPYFVTEYGGTPWGNSVPELRADLHAGIWATYMTHTAGTPFFWWFDLIDRKNWYSEFASLAAFHQGEDRIGKKYVSLDSSRFKCTEVGIRGLGIGNDKEGLAWVYSSSLLSGFEEVPTKVVPPSRLTILRMKEGTYDVEFWDTHTGKKIGSGTFTVVKNNLLIDLPTFNGDIALKFKKAAGNDPI
ncbi:MAG: hypothetical protein WC712_13615, partial [Candidatus Brocadiia bacterium]